METKEHDAMKQPERETTGGRKMEKDKDKANKLEAKLKEHFPNARYNDWPEFECIVVPMSKLELMSGKLETLLQTIKEHEEDSGYKLASKPYTGDGSAVTLAYENGQTRHDITVDGMFPNQVNIYYYTRSTN